MVSRVVAIILHAVPTPGAGPLEAAFAAARAPLAELPDVAADNGLPRWLAERGHQVRDLRARFRLQVDLDSPIDVLVAGQAARDDPTLERARATIDRVRSITRDPRAASSGLSGGGYE